MIILYTNVRTTKEFIWRYTKNEIYLMELMRVYITSNGTVATARQLATIIKRDVKLGKWNFIRWRKNQIQGLQSADTVKKASTYHSHMLIYGDRGEFTLLEALIKDYREVIPREYI